MEDFGHFGGMAGLAGVDRLVKRKWGFGAVGAILGDNGDELAQTESSVAATHFVPIDFDTVQLTDRGILLGQILTLFICSVPGRQS